MRKDCVLTYRKPKSFTASMVQMIARNQADGPVVFAVKVLGIMPSTVPLENIGSTNVAQASKAN